MAIGNPSTASMETGTAGPIPSSQPRDELLRRVRREIAARNSGPGNRLDAAIRWFVEDVGLRSRRAAPPVTNGETSGTQRSRGG